MNNEYDPKYVEKESRFRISQKAIIVNDLGEILLMKRSGAGGGGGWSFPGGGVEQGEDVIASITREIKEETNLDATGLRVFHVFTSSARRDDVCIGYTCSATGELELNWEHDAYVWIPPNKGLDSDLTIHARVLLEQYLRLNERLTA